jgi:hypothetical protein
MSTLGGLDDAVNQMGGNWIKLTSTDDPPLIGTVLSFEERDMTYEGRPVLSQKTGRQRREWVFTLDTGEDEPVKVAFKEAGQRAIANAIKANGKGSKAGDVLKIKVTESSVQGKSQAEYRAVWETGTALDIPANNEPDPFDTVTASTATAPQQAPAKPSAPFEAF